jgi:hypothetical protein
MRNPNEITPRQELRLALFQSPEPAWKVAARVGISAGKLSLICHGRQAVTHDEAQRIAHVLGVSVEVLFPDDFATDGAGNPLGR